MAKVPKQYAYQELMLQALNLGLPHRARLIQCAILDLSLPLLYFCILSFSTRCTCSLSCGQSECLAFYLKSILFFARLFYSAQSCLLPWTIHYITWIQNGLPALTMACHPNNKTSFLHRLLPVDFQPPLTSEMCLAWCCWALVSSLYRYSTNNAISLEAPYSYTKQHIFGQWQSINSFVHPLNSFPGVWEAHATG